MTTMEVQTQEHKCYGIMPRDQRSSLLGIDCPSLLEWRNWHPGTEYPKNLYVKNVSLNTLKLKYRQFNSKAFMMDFAETFTLRPGMSTPLKVVFRPIQMECYSDKIEIMLVGTNTSFIVDVQAFTPVTNIQVPPSLDFGFVPCKELQHLPLPVHNTGDVQVRVKWRLDAPFSISPQSGVLAPGQVMSFDVAFLPQEAGSFAGNATCILDDGSTACCSIAGIAKFPYLSVEVTTADFGEVLVGKSAEHMLRFGNHSMVPANFTVVPEGQDQSTDRVYSVQPAKGSLGPQEYSEMRVVYTPKHCGTFSCQNFVLSTPGGNRVVLNVSGQAVGPVVTFSSRVFQFGNVPLDNAVSRVLYIQNHSDVPAAYDFQVDPLDYFTFVKPQGTVGPRTTVHVTITFKATVAANFWRRVTCLISNTEPIGLDLLATVFSEKMRPPPLEYRHVVSYLQRVEAGGPPIKPQADGEGGDSPPSSPALGMQSPNLDASVTSLGGASRAGGGGEEEGGAGQDGALGTVLASEGLLASKKAGGLRVLDGPDGWRLMFGGQDPASAVTVDTTSLEFGTCSRLSASEYQPVTVTNHASAKITAFFIAPLWQDAAGGPPKAVFQVFPECADIKPGSSATFRVAFRPPRDCAHYCQSLTLCAHIKAMRNFRLLSDSQIVPPWAIPVLASGNTFLHANPELSPKLEISHRMVTFPPVRPQESSCQTVALCNTGDTPIGFSFMSSLASLFPDFDIKPALGVVPPHTNVLVALRFTPSHPAFRVARATLILNNSPLNATYITLRGAADLPRLAFIDTPHPSAPGVVVPVGSRAKSAIESSPPARAKPPSLYFRPTCVGASSRRMLTIHNPSRVAVGWKWQLPPKLEGVVSVTPPCGLLRGNEAVQVAWSFVPIQEKAYDAKAQCLLLTPTDNSHPQAEPQTTGQLPLRVVGEGTKGMVAIEPPFLDLGALRVGHPTRHTVSLVNQSDGLLRYSLSCLAVVPSRSMGVAPSSVLATVQDSTTVHGESSSLNGVADVRDACAGEPCEAEEVHAHNDRPGTALTAELLGQDSYSADTGTLPVDFGMSLHNAQETMRPEELWVDCPEGTIAARATKQLTLTFFPRFRKRYVLQLQCRTSVPPTSVLAPAPPLLRAPSASRGGPKLAPLHNAPGMPGSDATPSGAVDPATCGAPVPSLVTAECRVVAKAEFPQLQLTNVLCDGKAKQVLWDMLGVQQLNQELASSVSPIELELSRMEACGSLTTAAVCTALHGFELHTGCLALGGRPVVLKAELTNTSQLPVQWEIHNPEEPDVELENWIEPGRPQNEDEKARDFIREYKIFEMWPRKGTLSVGERTIITFKYNPTHEGLHQLPVFLLVRDGKRMHLKLRGETVRPPLQRLLMTPTYEHFTFAPAPIGQRHPPVQLYLLRNGGPSPVTFRVDTAPLAALAAANWGFPVLRLLSRQEGTIDNQGAAALALQFNPVEAKVYHCELPVVLEDGSVQVITLTGRGFHPDAPDEPPALPSESARDWSLWRGFGCAPAAGLANTRLLLPSQDTLTMGVALPRGVMRQVLMLTNTSPYPVKYVWDLSFLGSNALMPDAALRGVSLEVTPATGSLDPGERVLCRFTLRGGLAACLLEADVRCDVQVDLCAVRDAVSAAQETAQLAAQASAVDVTDTGSVIEEVLAVHPPPPCSRMEASIPGGPLDTGRMMTGGLDGATMAGGSDAMVGTYGATAASCTFRRGSKLKSRLPVHMYVTVAAAHRSEHLGQQWNQTQELVREREIPGSLAAMPELPAPQQLNILLTGKVLTAQQIQAGYYMHPQEAKAAAAALAEGTLWVPPTQHSFYACAPAALPSAASHVGPAPGSAGPEHDAGAAGMAGGARSRGSKSARTTQHSGYGAGSMYVEPSLGALEAVELLDEEEWCSRESLRGVAGGGDGEGGGDVGASDQGAAGPQRQFGSAGDALKQPQQPQPHAAGEQHSDTANARDVGPGGEDGPPPAVGTAEALGSGDIVDITFSGGVVGGCDSLGAGLASVAEDEEEGLPSPQAQPQQQQQQELPHVAPPSPPALPTPTPVQVAQQQAASLLASLLADVLDPAQEPHVATALSRLPPPELPAYVQLLQEDQRPPGSPPSMDAPAAPAQPLMHMAQLHSMAPLAAADDNGVGPAALARVAQGAQDVHAAGVGLAGGVQGGHGCTDAALRAVLREPAFQAFAECVLEGALLSLVQESAAGDWEASAETGGGLC